jgi:hypothetical protein
VILESLVELEQLAELVAQEALLEQQVAELVLELVMELVGYYQCKTPCSVQRSTKQY